MINKYMAADNEQKPALNLIPADAKQIGHWQKALNDYGFLHVTVTTAPVSSNSLDLRGQAPIRLGHALDLMTEMQRQYGLKQTDRSVFKIGDFIMKNGFLFRGDSPINLTDKERDILSYFCRADGHETDRKTLLDAIWGYAESVETHTLETHIYRLRQKIEADPSNPALLVTTEGGYALRQCQKL